MIDSLRKVFSTAIVGTYFERRWSGPSMVNRVTMWTSRASLICHRRRIVRFSIGQHDLAICLNLVNYTVWSPSLCPSYEHPCLDKRLSWLPLTPFFPVGYNVDVSVSYLIKEKHFNLSWKVKEILSRDIRKATMTSKPKDTAEPERITRYSDIAHEPLQMLSPIEGYENEPLVSIEEATAPLIGVVRDIGRRTWIAKEKCQKPPAHGLTIDESTSILLYTMEAPSDAVCLYRVLNTTLRAEDRGKLKPWFLYLRLFLTALSRLPTIRGTVYRGVKDNLSNRYPENKTHIWWGFSSCTLSIKVLQCEKFLGQTNARTMFAIDCHSAKDIREHSFYRKEDEVLLPAARQLRVMSCLNAGNDLNIVQLKELDPPFPLLEPVPLLPPQEKTPVSPLEVYIRQCPPSSPIHLWLHSLKDEDMDLVTHEAVNRKQCTELSV